jgi:hypothetical protein
MSGEPLVNPIFFLYTIHFKLYILIGTKIYLFLFKEVIYIYTTNVHLEGDALEVVQAFNREESWWGSYGAVIQAAKQQLEGIQERKMKHVTSFTDGLHGRGFLNKDSALNASTLVVTHQQAQFNKMKSKQQIKNQNTNRRQQTHPHQRRRACNWPASPAGKPTFQPEKISIADISFLSPNPESPAGKKPKKNQQNQKKTKPKLQIISSKIKSKQQI